MSIDKMKKINKKTGRPKSPSKRKVLLLYRNREKKEKTNLRF